MNVQRHCLSLALLAAATAQTALGQEVVPAAGRAGGYTQSAAAIPDFSGIWVHPYFPGFEPPASGPGPIVNRSRTRGGPRDGVGNANQFVGDYTNHILKPEAAEIVRKHGETSLVGETYPTPSNQCWPSGEVRLNEPHQAHVPPSWYGDSVAHYEGDSLVVDTVGVKMGPFAMVDMYGTPFTPALHVVERYRLLDYADAKGAIERNSKENIRFGPGVQSLEFDPDYRGKHLQLQFTVDDDGVFTMPWTATITYSVPLGFWEEHVCAENRLGYFSTGREAAVPTADKPDF
jgi:hypothetical protein